MSIRTDSVEDLQRVVRERDHVRVRGGGTKSSAAGPDDVVVAGLAGITEYSPDECVFTAYGGTPVREVTTALGAHGQYLPFDPPFAEEGATMGGTVASGMSGPRRYRYGGVRDFLIGIRVVDGEGRLIRSGGKVVKNAAGFLLHHGMVGSCGRFGVVAEVTFKVFPAPAARRTLTLDCESVEEAFAAARRIEGLRCDCEAIDFDERGALEVTVAGSEAAIEARCARLGRALGATSVKGTVPFTVPLSEVAPLATVKVAGMMTKWSKLRPHVTRAHFMCTGAVAWLYTDDVQPLARALDEARLVGQIIRGPGAGQRIGHVIVNEFEERVRRVLDPHNRFSAAPNSRH